MIIIGRAVEGIPLNGLEYLLNVDNTDYMFFKNKCEAMDFLNSLMLEPFSDEQLEDAFMFLDTETDFENPEAFNNE